METILMEIILRLMVTMDEVNRKKPCFGYFWRFAMSALTRRPWNTFSKYCLVFAVFMPLPVGFGSWNKLIVLYTKFWVNWVKVLASASISLLMRSTPVHWSYQHFLWFFKLKSPFDGLTKVRILVETLLIEINFRFMVTMDQVKRKELCFGCFSRFLTTALTLRAGNTYIYVFKALLGFCNI